MPPRGAAIFFGRNESEKLLGVQTPSPPPQAARAWAVSMALVAARLRRLVGACRLRRVPTHALRPNKTKTPMFWSRVRFKSAHVVLYDRGVPAFLRIRRNFEFGPPKNAKNNKKTQGSEKGFPTNEGLTAMAEEFRPCVG